MGLGEMRLRGGERLALLVSEFLCIVGPAQRRDDEFPSAGRIVSPGGPPPVCPHQIPLALYVGLVDETLADPPACPAICEGLPARAPPQFAHPRSHWLCTLDSSTRRSRTAKLVR